MHDQDQKSELEDAIKQALIDATRKPMSEEEQRTFEKQVKMLRRLNGEA